MANGANRVYFKKDRNAVKAVIATALAALLALLIAAVCYRSAPTVTAESGCTVTIHVYDPAQEYGKLAGWVWVGGDSAEWSMSASPKPGEAFEKDGNAAHAIDITFDTATAAKLKGGTKLGFLIVIKKADSGDWNTMYDKESLPDVMMDLSAVFDENNHADVYFVRKDSEAFTDLEEAKMALEKITSAKFTSKTDIMFEASSALTNGATVTLYDGDKTVTTGKATVGANKFAATVTLANFTFDFAAEYQIEVEKFPKRAAVAKHNLIDDVDFIRTFESADTQNIEYGAIIDKTKGETTFRLWAPLSSAVKLNLYDNGTDGEPAVQLNLRKRLISGKWGGVWELVMPYDYSGRYYTYSVTNSGNEMETIDPYAKACGANGVRGMVIDFDKANPDGWENDKHIYDIDAVAADTPIVWEVHVRDFSISPDSGMLLLKGPRHYVRALKSRVRFRHDRRKRAVDSRQHQG